MYGWGCNSAFQLPIVTTNKKYVFQPEEIDLPQLPLMIAAGDQHTVVLTEGGTVLSFGKGPAIGRDIASPSIPFLKDTIVAVAAGAVTSFAVTSTGRAYQWGLIHR